MNPMTRARQAAIVKVVAGESPVKSIEKSTFYAECVSRARFPELAADLDAQAYGLTRSALPLRSFPINSRFD